MITLTLKIKGGTEKLGAFLFLTHSHPAEDEQALANAFIAAFHHAGDACMGEDSLKIEGNSKKAKTLINKRLKAL